MSFEVKEIFLIIIKRQISIDFALSLNYLSMVCENIVKPSNTVQAKTRKNIIQMHKAVIIFKRM